MTEPHEGLRVALSGRYVLERELGRGGMATVYLAHDVHHDRPVALKVLHSELAATLGPERFLREIGFAARLQHPHILTVLDSGEAAGQLWFTMPYVEGESLRQRLLREKQLPLEDALRITSEAALALDFAHRHGVIHRDIKPENILLCDGQALVADFGIGRTLGVPTPGEWLTETGTVLGTPAYMSPEQASGERALDNRTDVYSLALVLYEMLAGVPPFTGPSAQAILAQRLSESPRPLRRLRDTVPDSVDQAVLKALARAPADRFQTAAEFAHALGGSATSAPLATGTRAAAVRRPWGRRLALAGAGLAVLAGGSVIALRKWKAEPTPLDPVLVAVTPFDVLQPALGLWREGMVDLMARNLDGAGPLRTVSPTAVVRRWKGRADRASAAALARSTGAGVVLYGTLVGTGPDSVRLTASVLDVGRDEVIGEAELRGTADRMDQLADSLTVQVLRELAQTRPIGAARSSGIGSRSLPALRAFLHGEQFFRRTEWDSARVSYERAIALDSGFALAYSRLSTTRGWQFSIGDSLANAYGRRAGALNQGLPPRESLLVLCDSLMSTLGEGELVPDSADRENHRRLFRAADRLTARYPTDPEAWVALGEARFHFGRGFGVSDAMKLEAFQRAIVLDSSYAPAYIHAVTLALTLDDPVAARRYVTRFLALRPGGGHAHSVRLVGRILGARAAEVERLLDSLTDADLVAVDGYFTQASDSAEVAVGLARRLAGRRITEDVWYRDPVMRQGTLAGRLAFRGHLREAGRIVTTHPQLYQWAFLPELALAGAIPADSADAFFRRRLNREPFWSLADSVFQEGILLGPYWWAVRGDSASLKRYIERINWRAHSKTPPPGALKNPLWLAAAEAYLALARRDTASALARLAALPDYAAVGWFGRLTLARLLAIRGKEREALAVLDLGFPVGLTLATRGIWALEHARLAEKLGEREKARYWYGHVAALWRHADPELQPSVAEAREALGRLTAEPGR